MSKDNEHAIGDGCPGRHFADPGGDGSCCMAAQDTDGRRHAWNCELMWDVETSEAGLYEGPD